MTQRHTLHFVDSDSRMRAELSRAAFSLGHHAEVYVDFEELLRHPPRHGIIVARDDTSDGGVRGALELLTRKGVWLPIIAVAEKPDAALVVQAIKAGALDYLALPVGEQVLASSLDRVAAEAISFQEAQERKIDARNRIGQLSRRERQVLDLLVDGHSNKQIARVLGISPRTVEIHRANMMKKLAVGHSTEAVRLALEAKLPRDTSPEPDASQDWIASSR